VAQLALTHSRCGAVLCIILALAARDSVDRWPKTRTPSNFFAERRARADFKAFDRLMRRKGGETPREDDKVG